jgi:hypothetical protein
MTASCGEETANLERPGPWIPDLALLKEVVTPAVAEAERACSDSFGRISAADLTRSAATRRKSAT